MYRNELISIVVPIYNVEKFLPACIESILEQSYPRIEVVLVDDGSLDNSLEICKAYASKDSRIVVLHKENGGLSDARNYGLEHSNGKYVTFIDSDDMVSKDFIKVLYTDLIENDAQISICDYQRVAEDAQYIDCASVNKEIIKKVYTNEECLMNTYSPKEHGMEFISCAKLYDIKIFTEWGIRFPVGRIHEDTFTTYKLLYYAKRIVWNSYVGYFYRMRSGSIMREDFNLKHLDMVEATKEACDFFLKYNQKHLADLAINFHIKTSFRMCITLYKHSNIDNKIAAKFCKNMKTDLNDKILKSNLPMFKKILYKIGLLDPTRIIMERLI